MLPKVGKKWMHIKLLAMKELLVLPLLFELMLTNIVSFGGSGSLGLSIAFGCDLGSGEVDISSERIFDINGEVQPAG